MLALALLNAKCSVYILISLVIHIIRNFYGRASACLNFARDEIFLILGM